MAAQHPTDAHYELQAHDRFQAELRRVALFDWLLLPVAGITSIGIGALAGATRGGLGSMIFGAFVTSLPVFVPYRHGRSIAKLPTAKRRLHVSFDEDQLTVADEAGTETQIRWTSFDGRRETTDSVLLELKTTGDLYILPRRAWNDPSAFDAAREFIRQRVAPSANPKVSSIALILAALMLGPTVLRLLRS